MPSIVEADMELKHTQENHMLQNAYLQQQQEAYKQQIEDEKSQALSEKMFRVCVTVIIVLGT